MKYRKYLKGFSLIRFTTMLVVLAVSTLLILSVLPSVVGSGTFDVINQIAYRIKTLINNLINGLSQIFPLLLILFLGIIVGFFAYQFYRKSQEETQLIEDKIRQVEEKREEQPEEFRFVWDSARYFLEKHFTQLLQQMLITFAVSVGVMLVGFAIIVWGIGIAFSSQGAFVPATLSTIAGLITEFIGATFLFVYRSTIQQAANHLNILERINSVGMAIQILTTMPDEAELGDLKNKTKASIVKLLVKQTYGTAQEPQDKQP